MVDPHACSSQLVAMCVLWSNWELLLLDRAACISLGVIITRIQCRLSIRMRIANGIVQNRTHFKFPQLPANARMRRWAWVRPPVYAHLQKTKPQMPRKMHHPTPFRLRIALRRWVLILFFCTCLSGGVPRRPQQPRSHAAHPRGNRRGSPPF